MIMEMEYIVALLLQEGQVWKLHQKNLQDLYHQGNTYWILMLITIVMSKVFGI